MTALDELIGRFAAGDVEEWQGLPAGLALVDVGSVLPLAHGGTGTGFLGDERRPARWLSAPSELYQGGLRVWHEDGTVLVLEGRDPFEAGAPLAAPELGEPEAALDTALGRLTLAGGEQVHAARGLALRVNPENGVLLGVLGFAPTTVTEYRTRLRPDLPPTRLLPALAAHRIAT